ncbi:MAG TPA: hypothetical protein VFF67_09450 [Thermoplasmata archaeon]|nr:hypothetical protein [Thermoplasmata archaeon]
MAMTPSKPDLAMSVPIAGAAAIVRGGSAPASAIEVEGAEAAGLRRRLRSELPGPMAGWVEDDHEPPRPAEPLPPVHLALLDARLGFDHEEPPQDALLGDPVHVWLVAGEGPPQATVRALELRIAFSPPEGPATHD